jgi:hypothetical protein
MKNNIVLITIVLLFTSFNVKSQNGSTSNCLTDSINISTGIDAINDALLPIGNKDPLWTISGVSGLSGGVALVNNVLVPNPNPKNSSQTYFSYIKTLHSAWSYFGQNSSYLSYSPTGSVNVPDNLSFTTTFARNFELCDADSILFQFNYRADGWLVGLKLDGITVPTYFPPSAATINNIINGIQTQATSSPIVVPSFTKYLQAGNHILTFEVIEWYALNNNPLGLSVDGKISSKNGMNSLLGNNPDCKCAPTSIGQLVESTNKINVFPNPAINVIYVQHDFNFNNEVSQVIISDITGRIITKVKCESGKTTPIPIPNNLSGTLFICTLLEEGKHPITTKVSIL